MLKSTEFLVLGDLHLEGLHSLFGEKGLDYQFQALKDGLDYALKNGIESVIILGDIFETPYPQQSTLSRLALFLGEYSKLQIRIILGNHDFSSTEANSLEVFSAFSRLQALANVNFFLKPTEQEIDGIPIFYLSWPHTIPPPAKYPRIVIAHLEVNGALRDNGMLIKTKQLVGKKDFWIIGHLHQYQTIGNNVVYPGMLFQKTFGESLPKGFLHVHAQLRGQHLTVDPIFIPYDPPFHLENIKIKSAQDLDKIPQRGKTWYKLVFSRQVSVESQWLTKHPQVLRIAGDTPSSPENPTAQSLEIDVKYGLDSYLKNLGFTKKQIKLANEMVNSWLGKT